jgi:transposase
MRTIAIGVDLAKLSFSTCAVDATGAVSQRRDLRRDAFAAWLAQQPAHSVVAMEACSGAHHWARRSLEHGLVPRLMAAQFVTPFRKRRGAKNDRNDAEAIATAARQGNMRFVPVKTIEQQARLVVHRVREGDKTEHLAVGNRLRGLLAEFGIIIAQTDAARIAAVARNDARCRRLQQLSGVGPLIADALVATIGDDREFKNGRQFAAWLGLTPAQYSTGGKARLGSITCRGDGYLRTLLIQGARSAVQRARVVSRDNATPEQLWIQSRDSRVATGQTHPRKT